MTVDLDRLQNSIIFSDHHGNYIVIYKKGLVEVNQYSHWNLFTDEEYALLHAMHRLWGDMHFNQVKEQIDDKLTAMATL